MSTALAAAEIESFRSLVVRRLGLNFDDGKLGLLEEVFHRRLETSRQDPQVYLERMETGGAGRDELRALARELTVGETFFFRHMDQFRAFAEVVLPDRMRARSAGRSLRILSAGCASGEEAYSLGIIACDQLRRTPGWQVSILGVDINPDMLAKAGRARYPAWSFRETPPEILKRWFQVQGSEFALEERARSMAVFEERNLSEEDPGFWQPGAYDVVFCRNVIMYLAPVAAEALVARICRALAPGGYLFLGHAETLRGLSHDFHLCQSHGTFYYQAKGPGERSMPAAEGGTGAALSHGAGAPLAAALAEGDSWVEAIRRAAERIQAISVRAAGAPPERPSAARDGGAGVARWDMGLAIELLRRERFAEALELVSALPPESARDPDVLLMRAVLTTHGGSFAEAERVCADLLALDEMSAGAHYVMALCREAAGDLRGALEHDRAAAYLDPGFAMPRLHLGLMARKAGDHPAARRELGQALVLLQREDASRLLLFGGGFSRETLASLCRAELLANGGRP